MCASILPKSLFSLDPYVYSLRKSLGEYLTHIFIYFFVFSITNPLKFEFFVSMNRTVFTSSLHMQLRPSRVDHPWNSLKEESKFFILQKNCRCGFPDFSPGGISWISFILFAKCFYSSELHMICQLHRQFFYKIVMKNRQNRSAVLFVSEWKHRFY